MIEKRLYNKAPFALQNIKRDLNDADEVSFSQLLDAESERHVRSGQTENMKEAVAAFFELRDPEFSGR